ncbi:CynX/NimT family MFS transporter [Aquipseudomonas alcaligenes]|uniref:MFS transporter n=1 Tax=Aquipseudomonas alcaligenes TaxID=43263 RepID=UPI0037490BAE
MDRLPTESSPQTQAASPGLPGLLRHKRWLVAASYTLVLCFNQLLVTNLIPLLSHIQQLYGLSELQASAGVLIFPIFCVLLSLPAGRFIDRFGFRHGTHLGIALMALAVPVRLASETFAGLILGQLLIALGQPLIITGAAKMAAEWFPEAERGKAIGLSTAGMFAGLALGLGLPPLLFASYGLQATLSGLALASLVPSALFILCSGERGKPASASQTQSARPGWLDLLYTPGLGALLLAALLGFGLFNALTLCLEPILAGNGLDASALAITGMLLIAGGVFGSLLVEPLAQRLKSRKRVLLGCGVGVISTIWLLFHAQSQSAAALYAALLGLCQLPCYALLLTLAEERVGTDQAASANALLVVVGNVGSALAMTAVALIHSAQGSWGLVITFLIGMALVQMLVVTRFDNR